MSNMAEVLHQFHGSKLLLVVTMLMVITMQPTPIKAVDIYALDNSDDCTGSGFVFEGIDYQTCAVVNAGSFLYAGLASCAKAAAYRRGHYTSQVLHAYGPTAWCFTGGSFTGAAWFNECRRRRLQGAETSGDDRCTHSVAPNGVHHTADPSKGSWALKTVNATKALTELQALLTDAEKVNWLKAQGAYHVPRSNQVMSLSTRSFWTSYPQALKTRRHVPVATVKLPAIISVV